MTQKIHFNNLTGNSITIGNTVIDGTGITTDGENVAGTIKAEIYANNASLPLSGLTAGQYAYTTANTTLFYTDGNGWYRVTTINETPSVTLSVDSVTLGLDGNTADFTYTVTDPEGFPVTIAVSKSGIANTSLANVQHYTSNNTITVNNVGFSEANTFQVIVSASDGINIGTATANVVLSFTPPASPIWDSYVVLSAIATSTADPAAITDQTGTSTITVSGASTNGGPSGDSHYDSYSILCDANEYVEFSIPATGTEDFTYECWVYVNSWTSASYGGIFASMGIGGPTGVTVAKDLWWVGTNSGGTQDFITTSTTIPTGQWVHIAVVRSGNTFTGYKDGISVGSVTRSKSADSHNTTNLRLARRYNNNTGYAADAYYQDVQVIKGFAKYTSNFTPPTQSQGQSYQLFNNTLP